MLFDDLDKFSERQTIEGTVLSDRGKYVGAPCDWGHGGAARYVAIRAHGNATLGSAIQFMLYGTNDPANPEAKAVLIDQTPQIKNADVRYGSTFFLNIRAIGKKYSYLYMKYLVAGGTEDQSAKDPTPCPPESMLNPPKQVANTYSAAIVLSRPTELTYTVANLDKETC